MEEQWHGGGGSKDIHFMQHDSEYSSLIVTWLRGRIENIIEEVPSGQEIGFPAMGKKAHYTEEDSVRPLYILWQMAQPGFKYTTSPEGRSVRGWGPVG